MISWIKDRIKGVKGEEDCLFCKIRDDPTDEKLNKDKKFLYEDEQFYAIHDIKKASAREHILVITKKHIRSALQVKDAEVFKRMKKIATQVLKRLIKQKYENEFMQLQIQGAIQKKLRLGFHVPPYNSIDHIHLHGFLEPITEWHYDKMFYGWAMTPVDEFIKKFQKN